MRIGILLTLIVAGAMASGCGPDEQTSPLEGTRDISLRSHLAGAVADDPEVTPGEVVRVVAAPDERYVPHDPQVVELPASTPFADPDARRLYLYGYAIGTASARGTQFT